MSTQVTYKGNAIANFTNDTKTLKTAGKYMEADVVIIDDIRPKYTVTLKTSGNINYAYVLGPDGTTKYYTLNDTMTVSHGDHISVSVSYANSNYILVNGTTVDGGTGIASYTYEVTTDTEVSFTLSANSISYGYIRGGETYYTASITRTGPGSTSYPTVRISPGPSTAYRLDGDTFRWYPGENLYFTMGNSEYACEFKVNGTFITSNNNYTYTPPNQDISLEFYNSGNEATHVYVTYDDSGDIDCPIFTIVWDASYYSVSSVTCNKTYAECEDYHIEQGNGLAIIKNCVINQPTTVLWNNGLTYWRRSGTEGIGDFLEYVLTYGTYPDLNIRFYNNGTINVINPSEYLQTLNITQNGTITNSDYFYNTINVNVSKKYTATITQTGDSTYLFVRYPGNSGTKYYTTGDTFEIHQNDEIYLYAQGIRGGGYIYVNNELVAATSYGGTNYTYTVPAVTNIEISLDYSSDGYIYLTTTRSELSITQNGGYDVSEYDYAIVNVAGGGTYQSKTVSPTTSQQTITPDSGYNALSSVTVNAMPTGTATAPTSISGTAATVSTGTNTLTLTKTVSVTPRITTAGYVSTGTAGNASVSLQANVTTKAAATITPGTTNQTIASGTYLTGTQTIAGDADLVASNIVSGVQIFGVTGNVVLQNYYTGSSAPSSSLGSNGDLYLQS